MESMSYYAVRRGRTPGIYKSWDEAKVQVHEYANAEYKKFKSEREAEEYMSALSSIDNVPRKRNTACKEGSAKKKRRRTGDIKYYYAVRVGRCPGIYHSWDEAEAQVKGYAKADFKKFTTKEDAEAYLPGPAEENMTRSDRESDMDEQAPYSKPTIKHDVESSCAAAEPQGVKKEPITTPPYQPKSEPVTSKPTPDATTAKGWQGLKEHRTQFEEKLPTPLIISKLHAIGLLLEHEYAELKGTKNNPRTNRKLIDFLLCKDDALVEDFKKELSDIHGYSHLVGLL